jgi:hypothetical protein
MPFMICGMENKDVRGCAGPTRRAFLRPSGLVVRAGLQIAAFACLVVGAVLLGHQQPPQSDIPADT